MTDPATLYKNFAHCSDLLKQQFQNGGYGLDGAYYQHLLSSWSVAGKSDDTGKWQAYYFLQLDSSLRTMVAGTFKINGYNLTGHLLDGGGNKRPDTELLAVTPDTTQGSTSYTTSLSQTVSASGGFFGEDPTASVGASVSFGHSVTRSIPDITVNNLSMAADGQNASWNLGLAEGALAQQDTMEFTTQMLFRVPYNPEDKWIVSVDFQVAVEDHDNNGSGYFDRTMGVVRPIIQPLNVVETRISDRGCWLGFPSLHWSVRAPEAQMSGLQRIA
jgi:hypothetical protein